MQINRIVFWSLCLQVILLSGTESKAQYREFLATIQPAKTVGPGIVGTGVIQLQQDFDWRHDGKIGDPYERRSNTIHLFRFGLSERVEIRWKAGWRWTKQVQPDQLDRSQNGFAENEFSLRVKLHDGKAAVPTVSMQIEVNTTATDEEYRPDYWAPRIVVMTGQRFGPLRVNTNLGLTYDGTRPQHFGWSAIRFGYFLPNRTELFLEHFGTFSAENWNPGFSSGVGIPIGKDFRFDLSGGFDNPDFSNSTKARWKQLRYFANAGISWRLRAWGPHRKSR